MRNVYSNINGQLIDNKMAPSDRTFRNAWQLDDKQAVEINMDKARKIHKDRLRDARKPLLEELDVEYYRSLESADTGKKDKVVEKKNKLRDITVDPRIEAASTPEELEALTIEVLSNEAG